MLVVIPVLLLFLGLAATSARRAWTLMLVRVRDVARAIGVPLAALHRHAVEHLAKVRLAHDRERPLNPLPVALMAMLFVVFVAMEFAGVAMAYPALFPVSSVASSAMGAFVDRFLEPVVALSIVLPLVTCGAILAQCYSKRPVLPIDDFVGSPVRRTVSSVLLAGAVASSLWVATLGLSTVRARALYPEATPGQLATPLSATTTASSVVPSGPVDLMADVDPASASTMTDASVLSQHEAVVMFSLMAFGCLVAAWATFETGVLPLISGGGAVTWLATVAPLALLLAIAALVERLIEVTEAAGHSLIGACEKTTALALRPFVTFARDRFRWAIGADGAQRPSVRQAVAATAFDVEFPDVNPRHREADAPAAAKEVVPPAEPLEPAPIAGDSAPESDDSDAPPSNVSSWEGAFPTRPRTPTL